MALALPASPTTGDTATVGGIEYRFDGEKWIAAVPPVAPPSSGGGGGGVTLPADASGVLSNDGSGGLSWDGSYITSTPDAGTSQSITAADAADVPLTINGASGQTANLQEWHTPQVDTWLRLLKTGSLQATDAGNPDAVATLATTLIEVGNQDASTGATPTASGVSIRGEGNPFAGRIFASNATSKASLVLNGAFSSQQIDGTFNFLDYSGSTALSTATMLVRTIAAQQAPAFRLERGVRDSRLEIMPWGDIKDPRFDESAASGRGYVIRYGGQIWTQTEDTAPGGRVVRKQYKGNTMVYQRKADGSIQNASGNVGQIPSDEAAKEDIADATPKLDDLLKLRVINYRLKDMPDLGKLIGFSAQQLKTVMPNMVEDAYTDEDGTEIPMSVKILPMVPMLIKALQELAARVEALESAP